MDINFFGYIEGIRYTDNSVLVIGSERRSGYKRNDGVYVDEELLTFVFVFKEYFKKYISEHFSSGMLVKIKGFMLPYTKEGDVGGYTLIGQTIDLGSYPSNKARQEQKRIKESMRRMEGTPDVESYMQSDF